MNQSLITQEIKRQAASVGFDACRICKAEPIDENTKNQYNQWITNGYQADMHYLARNTDLRANPSSIIDNGKSIICVALNYYPDKKQSETAPQFAYYAYGKDYHDIFKEKLKQLLASIQILSPEVKGRVFVDTAPILERYWAAKSGIGFIGKNSLLIIPQKGSYYFLGEIILDIELDYDKPVRISCGSCTRCLDACPTKAIEKPFLINSGKCISYQTIENKNTIIHADIVPMLNNYIYGCDICQKVCPWNRFAKPHKTKEFDPSPEFLELDNEILDNMTVEDYRRIFKGSAVKRAKFEGLKRNNNALRSNQI